MYGAILLLRTPSAHGSAHVSPGAAAAVEAGTVIGSSGSRFLVVATSSCEDVAPPARWLHTEDATSAESAALAAYDTVLFDYSINGTCARYLPAVAEGGRFHRYARPQTYKWPAMHAYFSSAEGRAALAHYDYFLLADDDIVFRAGGPQGVLSLFRAVAAARTHIAQPALSIESAATFAATVVPANAAPKRRGVARLRLTGFVEQMAPVFSAEALAEFLPHFAGLTHAWGIDALWSDASEKLGRRIGVFDSVVIDHMRPSGVSGLYKRIGGIERARADQAAFVARWAIRDSVFAAAAAVGAGEVVDVAVDDDSDDVR